MVNVWRQKWPEIKNGFELHLTFHESLLLCPPHGFKIIHQLFQSWLCFTLSCVFWPDINACVCSCLSMCTFESCTRHPSHLLNLMHALWTHLHPNTLKLNIEGGFSSIAPLTAVSIHWNPCRPVHPASPSFSLSPCLLACLLMAPGLAPGFFFLFFGEVMALVWHLSTLTQSDEISFQILLWSQPRSPWLPVCPCPTSSVQQAKTDLKCHFLKYHGIYLTYQTPICLTKMPLLPLRYLNSECWFSLIKIPDAGAPV